jgi:flagellin-like protein
MIIMRSIKRKGVSPVVATIILIAIVIVLALIIFLWARGFVAEKAQKFGRAVELSCDDVDMEVGIFSGDMGFELDVINRGNVPLYGFEIKDLTNLGSVSIAKEILGNTIDVGQSTSLPLENEVSGGDELLVVPVLLGETNSGKVAYTCPDQFGFATSV